MTQRRIDLADSHNPSNSIDIRGNTFVDRHGRHVILRGVNFAGDCKAPSLPDQRTFIPTDFSDHRTVSFVGRPAPLSEIDQHLDRLAHWGFNCIRLLTTWEAIEHSGPGEYDEDYLDFFAEVSRRAGVRGMYVIVDFHQDVWSRMSGGDGAPGWTFEVAGLDFTKFDEADAALTMQARYDSSEGGWQWSFPVMCWGRNHAMPANGIMWTLFFAGATFAPSATYEGDNVQDFLQTHYLGAMLVLAERLADQDHVIGFDTLNEPGTGYLGKNLEANLAFGRGVAWTPLHGLACASGSSQTLPVVELGKGVVGEAEVNSAGTSIWLPGRKDPFREAGAWDFDQDGNPVVVKGDYFTHLNGEKIDVNHDFLGPFFQRVASTIRSVRTDWLVFVETNPLDITSGHSLPSNCPERSVNASHWYDLGLLVLRHFSTERMPDILTGEIREGREQIENGYTKDLERIKEAGDQLNGGAPTLLGEFGTPFNINNAEAYHRWAQGERHPEIWYAQTTALELMYNAIDRLLLSSTQWNYTVGNSNNPMIGDGWNQEDLSIWSADQVENPENLDSGGRAITGFCRPYVRAAQGLLLSQRYRQSEGVFEAIVEVDPRVKAPTEIYVPPSQFPEGFEVLSAVQVERESNLLFVKSSDPGELVIRIERASQATTEIVAGLR